MSIISKNKEAKREARRAYEEKLAEMRAAEHHAMNEMLHILRTTNRLMTAAQLETACTSGISKHEIAGNLHAMKTGHIRYKNVSYFYGQRLPRVNIPGIDSRSREERIVYNGGGRRKATIVELDENGCIIPNSQQTVAIYESKRYGIEKIK